MMPSNHLIFCCPFSSCPQSFPASRSFPMSWLFVSGGQSSGDSALASVLPMNIQDWFPLGLTGLNLLGVQGTLKSLLQHHNLKALVLQCLTFFMVQLSHPYLTTGKTIALTIWAFVGKVMSLLFNVLLWFVIAFLPKSKCLLLVQLPSTESDFWAQENQVCHCFHFPPISDHYHVNSVKERVFSYCQLH